MQQILLVVQVLLAAGLIGIILLQRSETDGFGLGSGSGMNLLSGRAQANLLTRVTAIFAALFILNSLVLSVLAAHNKPASIVETIEQQQGTRDSDNKLVVPDDMQKALKEKPAAPVETAPPAPEPVKAKKKPAVKPADATDSGDTPKE